MRVRRARHLVSYWRDGRLIIENYRRRVRVAAEPLTLALLHACDEWRSITDVARLFPTYSGRAVREALRELVDASLLDRAGRRPPGNATADTWGSWDPAAGLLHFSSKDLPYRDATASKRVLIARRRREPMPAARKRYVGAARVTLPPPAVAGEFPTVLLERRTWRRFADGGVSLGDLATLLGLSSAIKHWVTIDGIGRLPLKTYPSGGGQHPLEVYVLARRVTGLPPGLYHYAADAHALTPLARGATSKQIVAYVPTQQWYGRAAALFLITAVFPRTQWKYRNARAYRVVLAEAGHLCQNFCLTATWLGLAPFCTMALADTRIERDLGIDGVQEGVLYAAGVGARPRDTDWAPWPTPHKAKRTPGPLARSGQV
jgi:SagB-type dehydrogenase family enzyme